MRKWELWKKTLSLDTIGKNLLIYKNVKKENHYFDKVLKKTTTLSWEKQEKKTGGNEDKQQMFPKKN